RRRHTRSDRDWSSDVCSSDLDSLPQLPSQEEIDQGPQSYFQSGLSYLRSGLSYITTSITAQKVGQLILLGGAIWLLSSIPGASEIGRASCRERREMTGVTWSV